MPITFPKTIKHHTRRVKMPKLLDTRTATAISAPFIERDHLGFQDHPCMKARLPCLETVVQVNSTRQVLRNR